MELKIVNNLAVFYENKIPDKYLNKLEDYLFLTKINIEVGQFLAKITILLILFEILIAVIVFLLDLDSLFLIIPFLFFPIFYSFILIKQEKRATEIEKTSPDFLRQLASILKVGLSFENAMEDISKYSSGPLYDEIRRTIIEIKMGRNFNEAWQAMAKRLNSKELERIFLIILDSRRSGSSVANVILDISNDLRDLIALKRERKSSVMMSVMFLIISAVIACPFSFGMVNVYTSFMQQLGKSAQIIQVAPVVGQIYLLIHSFLVGLIISIIMYGSYKKGFKFSLVLVFISYGVYFGVSKLVNMLLVF